MLTHSRHERRACARVPTLQGSYQTNRESISTQTEHSHHGWWKPGSSSWAEECSGSTRSLRGLLQKTLKRVGRWLKWPSLTLPPMSALLAHLHGSWQWWTLCKCVLSTWKNASWEDLLGAPNTNKVFAGFWKTRVSTPTRLRDRYKIKLEPTPKFNVAPEKLHFWMGK